MRAMPPETGKPGLACQSRPRYRRPAASCSFRPLHSRPAVSLNDVVTFLLLPPVNLVPLGLAGQVLARRYPRAGGAVTGGALLALLVLATPNVSQTLLDSLQRGVPRSVPSRPVPDDAELPAEAGRPAGAPAGAIVVLSAESSGSGVGGILPWYGIGPLTLERLVAGASLSRRLMLPILVTGGEPAPGAPTLAAQMARSLREDFGLAAAWVEPKSRDTWENAAFSAAILRPAGIRTVYLVTSAWHMRRALIAFRHFGIDAIPVAARFEAGSRWDADGFVPRVSAWLRSYYAFHEWVGCAWYALRVWADGPARPPIGGPGG
jgi:uncharacterized SAM-binding protein YcdF (DUF218 family)